MQERKSRVGPEGFHSAIWQESHSQQEEGLMT